MLKTKFIKSFLLVNLLPLLFSCSYGGFDEETGAFVESFAISEAMNNTKIASLTKTSILLDNDVIIGEEVETIEFDKSDSNNIYYYYKLEKSGEFISNEGDEPNYKERIINKLDSTYKEYLVNDEATSLNDINESEINLLIQNFFYTQETSGIYTTGYYYGDSIKINTQFYREFKYDKEEETLTFQIINDITNENYLINNTFKVNKYGMLLTQETSTKEVEGTKEAKTIVEANYSKIDNYHDISEIINEEI